MSPLELSCLIRVKLVIFDWAGHDHRFRLPGSRSGFADFHLATITPSYE